MKNDLYILYDYWYPQGDGGGTESFPIAFCLANNEGSAIWQFKLMGFSDVKDVRNISSFDDDGFMFKVPEYLLPY